MGFLLKIEGDFGNFYVDFFCKIEGDLNFLVNFFLAGFIFKGIYYIKLKMKLFFCPINFIISLLVACYLTVSLRGPVLKPKDEGDSPSYVSL